MNKTARVLTTLCVVMVLACVAAIGQEVNPFADIDEGSPLADLQQAADYERGKRRQELVSAIRLAEEDLASSLTQKLVSVVANRREMEDNNLVGHCILALGSLKERQATDVLLGALDAGDMQIAYQAAMALGQIWEAGGLGQARGEEVSLSLLTSLYSGNPQPMVYGPALALCRIHGIQDIESAMALPADELLSTIDQWMLNNRGQLPAMAELPWQVVFRIVLVSPEQTTRQQALQALLQRRGLGPVDAILDVLQEGETPQDLRDNLTDMLGQVTGVPYPPSGLEEGEDPVAVWRNLWREKLKRQTEQRYIDYAWAALGRALKNYQANPNAANADRIRELRLVLLHQLGGTDAIPAGASQQALDLLQEPLQSKELVANALATLQNPEAGEFQKDQSLTIIEEETDKEHGQAVGMQFLVPLAELAYDETNLRFAERLGNLLWVISGVPLQLHSADHEVRRQTLTDWSDAAEQELGITLDLG